VNAVLDDRFLNIVLPYKPLGVEDPVRLNALNLFIEQQGLDGKNQCH
jgi:hypothetical protein